MPLRGIEPRPNGLKVRHAAITPQRHTSLPSPLSVFEFMGRDLFVPSNLERQAGVEPASSWFEAKCLCPLDH